jgi:hypothetical protein
MANHDVVSNSSSGSNEEEEEEEEDDEEVEQSFDGHSGSGFESTSSAAMYSRVTEMSRQSAEMMEMHRNQQLIAQIKSAELHFHSIRLLRRNPQIEVPITQTRSAADIIGVTQADEDFERDFLASQSSRTTARIRLQEKCVKVATIYKEECPEEINECIRDIAFNTMAKSVVYEDIDPADRAFGVFKKKTVSAF